MVSRGWKEVTFELLTDDCCPTLLNTCLLIQVNQLLSKHIQFWPYELHLAWAIVFKFSTFHALWLFIYTCVRLFFGNVYSYDILNIYKVRSSISRLGLFLIWLLNTGLAKYLVFSASTVIITSLRSLSVKMFTLIFGCHLFKAFEAVPVRQQKNLSCGVRIDLGLELGAQSFTWKIYLFIGKYLF